MLDLNLMKFTTLSIKKISKFKKELIELNLIKTKVFGMTTKTEYFINFNKILEKIKSLSTYILNKRLFEIEIEYGE